jgi:hypothetical protein
VLKCNDKGIALAALAPLAAAAALSSGAAVAALKRCAGKMDIGGRRLAEDKSNIGGCAIKFAAIDEGPSGKLRFVPFTDDVNSEEDEGGGAVKAEPTDD